MIPIQNVYYMLSYAFQVLNEDRYRDMATEEFENAAELCAAILIKGIYTQLKRGLGREYIEQTEALASPRGRIEVSESLKTMSIQRKRLVCLYDEFSVNSYLNRILKTTMEVLLRADISKSRKKELRKLLVYFADVEILDVHRINWNVQYNRNNQTYRMLVTICYLVVKGLLQSDADGSNRMMDFFDEQRMCRLYEKFLLEYYRKEHPELTANASQIAWQLDDDITDLLPTMQSDIMLTQKRDGVERVLIIDAKYYSHTTQVQFDTHTVHSGNLYQIFTYVKNKEAELKASDHEVSGMLLYARTDAEIQPSKEYHMSGNRIAVSTLELNCEFSEIRKQLDGIVDNYFM